VGHPNLPTPSRWFWYYGAWRGRRKDNRVIFLRRHASDFHIIYPRPSPTGGLDYFDLKDRQAIISISLALSPGRISNILRKFNHTCQCCGASVFEEPNDVHHILPILFGGKDNANNLTLVCRNPCHYLITRAVRNIPESTP
jgi:5-methylcytosine-specific restriction endonuclease McrA